MCVCMNKRKKRKKINTKKTCRTATKAKKKSTLQ